MNYSTLSKEEQNLAFAEIKKKYQALQREKLSLDISRGKPSSEQLDLSLPLLDMLSSNYKNPKGAGDYRNYGYLDGIPEAKALFAELLEVSPDMVFVAGNSSLHLIYDVISDAYCFGIQGNAPWSKTKVKFLCPVPGYDRHFAILDKFGIEMIAIPSSPNGPDMDLVEQLVQDSEVKGIICVPRFGNPDGGIYSDETVERLANMKVGASDFRIYWDNAYFIHEFYPDSPKLKNIFDACKTAGNIDRVIEFASTSKITFPGAGVAVIVMGENNMKEFKKNAFVRTISYNKLNQYAHVLFLKDSETVKSIMAKHAEMLKPRFDTLEKALEESFSDCDYVDWTIPKGGYFVSLNVMQGTAKRVVELCKNAGLTLTPAGATYPLGIDDLDRNIRLAPSCTVQEELQIACNILVCAIEYAILEKLTTEE